MTLSAPNARAVAAYQEETTAHWRAYCRYIRAHQTLLDVRAADVQTAFEQAESLEAEEREAEAILAALTSAQRALFDAVRERRRQQVQVAHEAAQRTNGTSNRARLLDPDGVDRQTLTELLGEAEGRTTPDTWGRVPRGTPDDWRFYRVDVAALLAAPTAAAYSVGGGENHDPRLRLFAIGGIVVLVLAFMGVWFGWVRAAPAPSVASSAITVNATPVQPAQPNRLIVVDTKEALHTLSVTATQRVQWPRADAAQPHAYWRTTAVLPLTFCVPSALLSDATAVRVVSDGVLRERVYRLNTTPEASSDIVLMPCAGEDAAPRYGVLQTMATTISHAVGDTVAISDSLAVRLRAATLDGPGQDPTLPTNRARVTLVVTTTRPLDWLSYRPTLRLASGEAVSASEHHETADGAELRYLVPLPSAPLDAAWDVIPPDQASSVRWRMTFAPPLSRAATLDAALEVGDPTVQQATGNALIVRVSIRNCTSAAFTVVAADVSFTQSDRPVAVSDMPALRTPLEAGATRTVEVRLPPFNPAQPLILTVGTQRWQIAQGS